MLLARRSRRTKGASSKIEKKKKKKKKKKRDVQLNWNDALSDDSCRRMQEGWRAKRMTHEKMYG